VAELNSGLAHPQSQASGRISGTVIVPNFTPPLGNSESESEPGTTLGNKNEINEALELGEMPAPKPDNPYGF
jgi:hypothetical protein